jgi:hypothetical protein
LSPAAWGSAARTVVRRIIRDAAWTVADVDKLTEGLGLLARLARACC